MRSRASSYALLGLLSVPAVARGGLLAGSAAAAEGECGGKPVTVDLSVGGGQAPTNGDDVIAVPAGSAVDGLDDNDTICVVGTSRADVLKGNGAANKVNAGSGADKLYGGAGRDSAFSVERRVRIP